MYWVRLDTTLTLDEEAEESQELNLEADVPKEDLDDVLKDSVFGEGAGIMVPQLGPAGNESFNTALAKASGVKPPLKLHRQKPGRNSGGGTDGDGTTLVQPAPEDDLIAIRDQCLQEHTEAHKLTLQLDSKKYGVGIKSDLAEHSSFMKAAYQSCQEMLTAGTNVKEATVKKIQTCVEPKFVSYKELKAVAESMLKATTVAKPKAKRVSKTAPPQSPSQTLPSPPGPLAPQ